MLLDPALVTPELVLPAGAEFGGPLVLPVLARGGAPLPAVILVTMQTRNASTASLAAPVPLVGVEALGAGVAVTRPQTPAGATSLQEIAPGSWAEVAADLPRWSRDTRRLLVVVGDTNLLPNARLVGGTPGVIGSGGVMPTGTATFGTGTFTLNGVGVEDGIPYAEFRFQGSGTIGVDFATSGSIAANNTQVHASTFFVKLVAGSLTNVIPQNGMTVGGGTLFSANTNITPTGAALGTQRTTHISGSSGGTSNIRNRLRLQGSGAYDLTLRIGAPQLELTAASTPVLPVVGTPASATRGIDVPIWTPSAMPARGAIMLRGTVPALAGASPLGLLQLDDGTNNNRIVARIAAGGGQPEVLVVASGVTVATLTPTGALTAGSEWRVLLPWSPGAVRFGTTSGGVVTANVAPPLGIVRAVLGHADASATQPLGGEFTADLYDYWPSAAEALALLTA